MQCQHRICRYAMTPLCKIQSKSRIKQKQSPEVFCKKKVFEDLQNTCARDSFLVKLQCQRLFFNKVADFRPAALLKKSVWHRCFPVNFAKFLRRPFLQNTFNGCFCTWWKVSYIYLVCVEIRSTIKYVLEGALMQIWKSTDIFVFK